MLAMVMLQYVLPLLAITYAYGHMAKVTTKLYSSSETRTSPVRVRYKGTVSLCKVQQRIVSIVL